MKINTPYTQQQRCKHGADGAAADGQVTFLSSASFLALDFLESVSLPFASAAFAASAFAAALALAAAFALALAS